MKEFTDMINLINHPVVGYSDHLNDRWLLLKRFDQLDYYQILKIDSE
jgi:hypothetical protein